MKRFLILSFLVMCYAFFFTAQRIESREKRIEIARLTNELEVLNSRKQELTLLISKERQRLIQKSESLGKILSPKDVIVIE